MEVVVILIGGITGMAIRTRGWVGDFGVDLNFNFQNNATPTVLNYNLGGWFDIGNIVWRDTYNKSMTLSGSPGGISFKQKLENYSSFGQTVTMDLSGGKSGATAIELNPVNGNLTMSGNLYNDFSNDYLVFGTTGKTLTLNTTLGVGSTAANVDFSVEQASNVQVNSNQTYGGSTTVKAGSFKTGSSVSLASSGIVVSGGTFETTSANVVVNTGTVSLSSGEYKLGGNDSVASLTISGGLLSSANASTLTAATYALQGGTVSANLGAGTVNASSGTTLLSGTSAAANVNVQGGTLNTGSANRLDNGAAVCCLKRDLGHGWKRYHRFFEHNGWNGERIGYTYCRHLCPEWWNCKCKFGSGNCEYFQRDDLAEWNVRGREC